MQKMTAIELHKRYALVRPADAKKAVLVQLIDSHGKLTGIIQNNQTIVSPDKIEVLADDILTVFLSRRPLYGTAYGTKVEPVYKSERLGKWGNLHYYRDLTEAEVRIIHRGFAKAYESLIRKYNLRFLLPITIEIRQNSGKQIGSFRIPKGDTTGIMQITHKSFIETKAEGVQETVSHELGHPIWDNYMSKKLQAAWVRLYHSTLEVGEISLADMTGMRRDFISSGMSTAGYRKALTEENQAVFDACVAWISATHFVSGKFLDLLVADEDNLKDYWPKTTLHLSELKELVTNYGTKDPCELFCESLAWLSVEKHMPESVKSLMKKTLKEVNVSKKED